MQVRGEHGRRAIEVARQNPIGETLMHRDELFAAA